MVVYGLLYGCRLFCPSYSVHSSDNISDINVPIAMCVHRVLAMQCSSCSAHYAGGLLLSGGRDAVVRVWDMDAHVCRRTLVGHTDTILHLAALAPGLSVNGNFAGGRNRGSHASDLDAPHATALDPDALERDDLERDRSAPVQVRANSGLQVLPEDRIQGDGDGQAGESGPAVPTLIASCSADGTTRLWSASCWRCIYVLNPNPGALSWLHGNSIRMLERPRYNHDTVRSWEKLQVCQQLFTKR